MKDEIKVDFEQEWYPRLREITGYYDMDVAELDKVAAYLSWANFSELELQFELTDEDLSYIRCSSNKKTYQVYRATEQLTDFRTYTLVR